MEQNRILIIDDDEAIRTTLQIFLSMEGYAVSTAKNGKEGLALLEKEEPFSLILLDVMMPVMDGMSFLKEFEKNASLQHPPVVLITAFYDHMSELCGYDILDKPIDLNKLLHKIVDIMT